MRHSKLELDTVYTSEGGSLYALIDKGKYVLWPQGGVITSSPAGAKSFGVLVVTADAGDSPSDADVAALLAVAATHREQRPAMLGQDGAGYTVDVMSLATLKREWSDFVRWRAREAEAEVVDRAEGVVADAERASNKDAAAAVFGVAASEPVLAAELRAAGMLRGSVDLDIFVPDTSRLLRERRYWEDSMTIEPTHSIGLSMFLKGEAEAALRRGYGSDAYFTCLSTSRDLSEATRLGDGYLVPVEVAYEVISPAEYVGRLNKAFGDLR